MLRDAASDDVSFGWVLAHLGLRDPDEWTEAWRPSAAAIDQTFESLNRLVAAGSIEIGRLEYIDGGPAGRIAPVRHVPEPIGIVRNRVHTAVAASQTATDWEFQGWVVRSGGAAPGHQS